MLFRACIRQLAFVTISLSLSQSVVAQDMPAWLKDPKRFCAELSKRVNKNALDVPVPKPRLSSFEDFPAVPVAPARAHEGVLGKGDWTDPHLYAQIIRTEASKGPDFAGRYAILAWSCGSWCANATIADVQTGKTYGMPFAGVVGCSSVTGEFEAIERHADSSLLIVRGSLEVAFGHYADEGPCGTFYFRWVSRHLQLIGCEVAAFKDGVN